MPHVRPWSKADREACLVIVRGLPDFFTEDVPETVRRDLDDYPAWVVIDDGTVAGFAVVKAKTERSAELLWAVVAAASRRAGLGRVLVDAVLAELGRRDVILVEAKTVDASAGPPHDSTCAFWEAAGFLQIDTIDPLPGWQPGNPSAIYVAALGPTRRGSSVTSTLRG